MLQLSMALTTNAAAAHLHVADDLHTHSGAPVEMEWHCKRGVGSGGQHSEGTGALELQLLLLLLPPWDGERRQCPPLQMSVTALNALTMSAQPVFEPAEDMILYSCIASISSQLVLSAHL